MPGSAGRSEIRILYIFDPRRNDVLLVAGGQGRAVGRVVSHGHPLAEERYEDYLKHEDT